MRNINEKFHLNQNHLGLITQNKTIKFLVTQELNNKLGLSCDKLRPSGGVVSGGQLCLGHQTRHSSQYDKWFLVVKMRAGQLTVF